MRILRVISSMDPVYGGPCQGIRNSVPALNKLGVINEVVTLDDPSEPFLKNDPFIIHALGKARNIWSYHAKLLPWLKANIERFDIIIVHGIWLYHAFAVRKAVRDFFSPKRNGARAPRVFVMPHGMLDPWFQINPSRRLKAIRNRMYWNWVERKNINGADGLLFTCSRELELARKAFSGYSPKKEMNIGYGIENPPAMQSHFQELLNDVLPEIKNKSFILYMGRVDEKKGVDLLINAYLSLMQKEIQLPYLVIAGPEHDRKYGNFVRRLSANESSITFTGMVTGDVKWELLHFCEAFILPSHQENFGISVVEALACGKPVLISDKINICEEIDSENAGIIETDTEHGVQQMLMKWVTMAETEKAAMGRNARQCFEKYFSIERSVQTMIEKLSS